MSYPYNQYSGAGEDLSNPTSPLTYSHAPLWELENEQQSQNQPQPQPQKQHQHQQQHQQQAFQQQQHLSSEQPSPPPPQTPQQNPPLLLKDPPHSVPSQRVGYDNTPVLLHHPHHRQRESLRNTAIGHRPRHVETASSGVASTSTVGPSRQTRHANQHRAVPYARPPTSAPPRQPHVRFSSVQPSVQPSSTMQATSSAMHSPVVPMTAMPSPALPSPASAPGGLLSFASVMGSPVDTGALPPPTQDRDERRRKYMLRLDSWYDAEAKKLEVMLEAPGVSQDDIRVTLSTCPWNGVKQITVSGVMRPVFPAASAVGESADGLMLEFTTLRERKFGEFTRTFAVPVETNREDIKASMKNGVLCISVQCSAPVPQDSKDVPIQFEEQLEVDELDKAQSGNKQWHVGQLCHEDSATVAAQQLSSVCGHILLRLLAMVDDKYIGIALALSGSVLIGTSFIITKKAGHFTLAWPPSVLLIDFLRQGLNDAAKRNAAYGAQSATDTLSYLKNPIWWMGLTTIANFAAYAFAPPILVTPLGALSVLIGAVLASFLLNEELGHLGRLGCTLCFIGALIIVLHAPEDKDIQTVDEYLSYALRPGFLLYCFTVLVFTLIMVYGVAPKYGRSNPLIYISICSLVGSVSVMAIKGFGIAVKLTFGGKNQLTHPDTYVLGMVVALCILVQMNYFNKALDTFSTNVVNPMYFVGFTSATITASLILFQGFNTSGATNTVSLLCGFAVTFTGVHLLNISRTTEPVLGEHSALEGGLMNPRLSLQGRMSLDGWNGDARIGPAPAPRHSRQGSLYRNQTLFNAFDEHEGAGEAVGLQQLREEDSEDDDDADERTRLKSGLQQHQNGNGRHSGSRSHSHSPIPSRPASTEARIALS
ncbi:hypothetical protein H0H92_008197 [Tricholoma furcatifolium]|nr:hypothetical protein H0H92_008197 [Tricholoma furcatifolium]